MAKTKTSSVRLPKEMYEEIDNICDEVGCSRNDWIKDTLQDKLREENNENSQGQEVIEYIKPEPKPKPNTHEVEVDFDPKDYEIVKAEPKPTVELISTPTITIQDNSNKPQVDMVLFNGKYIPKAEVYEI